MSSSSKQRRSGGLSDSDKKRAKRATPEEMMKRRLWTLYRSVFDATVRILYIKFYQIHIFTHYDVCYLKNDLKFNLHLKNLLPVPIVEFF